MKIVLSIKALNNSGGTERVTAVLASQWAQMGHEVHIVSFVGAGQEPFFSIHPGVKLHYLAGVSDRHLFPIRDIRRIVLLKKLYRAINPDVVIIVDAGRSFVNIPAAKAYKTITWEHFNVGVNWHWGHRLSRKIAARYSDLIVTLTQPDADAYMRLFGARRAMCIYNPITIECAEPSPLSQKICLAIGRFSPQKNFVHLIQAWAQTTAKNKGWRLRIVGAGEQKKLLEQTIAQCAVGNSVELLDRQKDVLALYRSASLYAMSSHHEGLPLVLIEAMAMGLPIVSYDCPTGPADIITHQQTGLLVPYLNIQALASSLDELMLNPQKLQAYAQESLKQVGKFSTTSVLNQWNRVFKSLGL